MYIWYKYKDEKIVKVRLSEQGGVSGSSQLFLLYNQAGPKVAN